MSIYMCERCHSKEATETSAAGRFCQDCDAVNDLEVMESVLHAENTRLRQLIQQAYHLLSAMSQPFDTVERYDVIKWLDQASPFVEEQHE